MADTLDGLKSDAITQFCVFVENKVGRLNQLVRMLASINVHVLAISTQDTTDCAIDRIIVDDPEKTRQHLNLNAFAFCESEMICVEMDDNSRLAEVLAIIANAEINISYLYPFIHRPEGKCAIAFHLDDPELAKKTLIRNGMRVLNQKDLAR